MSEQVEEFRRLERGFRTFGNLLCVHGKTFRDKLNGAIAIGLAEVCELLAVESQIVESPFRELVSGYKPSSGQKKRGRRKKRKTGFARMAVVEEG